MKITLISLIVLFGWCTLCYLYCGKDRVWSWNGNGKLRVKTY